MAKETGQLSWAERVQVVDEVIRRRRTTKVFADPENPADITAVFMQQVNEAVAVSGWAPFHYPAHHSHRQGAQTSKVPWRFYIYDTAACRQLIPTVQRLAAQHGATQPIWRDAPQTKQLPLLAAAGAMVQVTWLPDPPQPAAREAKRHRRNEQHMMAAAAAVQNLLLAATARGLESYWSSEGCLRTPEARAAMGVPVAEKLVGFVYLFPAVSATTAWVTGKLRDSRGCPADWATWK